MYFIEMWSRCIVLFAVVLANCYSAVAFYSAKSFECGPYGFVCEGNNKLRLCEGDQLLGPAFLCPPNTICNEDSNSVCENAYNYIDPAITRSINCRRNERVADPSVSGCKGYILCVPNKNRFQGIKFKCSGNTIFNGYTRTCSAPDKYRCPLTNKTKTELDYFGGDNRRITDHSDKNPVKVSSFEKPRPIDCQKYKFTVTEDNSPVRATYFCPSRPTKNGGPIKCTVFSNQYCLTLEKYEEDQFITQSGLAYRRPRVNDLKPISYQ